MFYQGPIAKHKYKALTIAHNIFLSRNQRYKLGQWLDTSVTVVGHCVPVWYDGGETNEPAQEVFCNYVITNGDNPTYVRTLEDKDGFKINLFEKNMRQSLLDSTDGGCGSILFTNHGKAKFEDREYHLVNFVSIHDESFLRGSLT